MKRRGAWAVCVSNYFDLFLVGNFEIICKTTSWAASWLFTHSSSVDIFESYRTDGEH